MVNRVTIFVLLALTLAGCRRGGIQDGNWLLPDAVVISTPGVVIDAADGSWRLSSAEAAAAPFYSFDCVGQPTSDNMRLGERIGGRRVVVYHPAHDEPLHGVLSLCRVHRDVRGALTESYNIQIPESYVAETSGGRTSVVFEPTGKVITYADGRHDVPAWALWLRRGAL